MLPLESKALISNSPGPRLLKVVGLADFPSAVLPHQRMALDLRGGARRVDWRRDVGSALGRDRAVAGCAT